MHRKLIRGTLIASNTEAAKDPNIPHRLFQEMSRNYLRHLIIWNTNWPYNGLEFKRSSPVLRGREDAMAFISSLNTALQSEPATKLCFSGEFRITIETSTEPIVFRVYVEEGKVSYEEAEYVWRDRVTVTGLT